MYTQISKASGYPGWTAGGRSQSLRQHSMSQQKGFAGFPLSVKSNIPPASDPPLLHLPLNRPVSPLSGQWLLNGVTIALQSPGHPLPDCLT